MIDGLLQIGIETERADTLASQMEKYINEIILFNSAYNLTNTSDRNELIVRHIFDSLAPYNALKSYFSSYSKNHPETAEIKIGDIGSGGGLPGIPLAAAFPDLNFYLVERMSKRCAFLENVTAILGLRNVSVVNKEAEKVQKDFFDFITFRAFRPLGMEMTETLLAMTKPGGYLLAYKAKKENIETEMQGISSLVSEYELVPLNVPNLLDAERNLVVIQKRTE